MLLPSVVTQSSHITCYLKWYLLKCAFRFCLQNDSGCILSLGYLIFIPVSCVMYLVRTSQPVLSATYLTFSTWVKLFIIFFHLLRVILWFEMQSFFNGHARNLGATFNCSSMLPLLLRTSRKAFSYLLILSLLGFNFYEYERLWFFISVLMMVLTTCHTVVYVCTCYTMSSFEGRNCGPDLPIPSILLMA